MKKITLLAAIAMVAFTSNVVAQETATATAATSATVITPISIVKDTDMSFGNLVSTLDGGAIVLSTASGRTGNAGILAGPDGTVTAAAFTVTGETDFTYGITLPASPFDVENSDEIPETMAVGTFVSLPDEAGSLTSGTQTLLVGATITLGTGQASGVYTNAADLAVTVFYN